MCRVPWRAVLSSFDTPTEDRPELEVDRWARDDALSNGIANRHHDHWNCSCGSLGSQWRWRSPCQDQVHFKSNQLSRQAREPFVAAIGRSVLDDWVLPLNVPKFPQSLSEAIQVA
jgi:hypothetical protein